MPRIRSSSSRSPFLPAELRGPLLAGAGVFVASWLFLSFVPTFSVWLIGDVRFYETWGGLMAGHLVPYRDFRIEYPPGALPMFLGPVYLRKLAGYHGTYYEWFRVELLVIGLLADVISGNRKLLEDLLYRVRTLELPAREPEHERPPLTRAADPADRWEH